MAHNLYVGKSGQASMFYFGQPAWHRLGQKLDHPATAAQAIEAAGLDYQVVKRPLFTKISRQSVLVPDHFATVRSDTGTVLGVVGSRYEPVQNRDAVEVVGDSGVQFSNEEISKLSVTIFIQRSRLA
jgi:hypothetical protein